MASATLQLRAPGANGWLAGIGALLATALALAAGEGHLDISPTYDDAVTGEIYAGAGSWRKPPVIENDWRPAQEPQQEGRIQFGHDSTYELMRARQPLQDTADSQLNLGDPKPNTLFRLSF